MSGAGDATGFAALAGAIERASAHLHAQPFFTPRDHADADAYLAGLVEVALQQQLHGADPARPRFTANPSATAKWGADNVDNRYLWAPIDPTRRYRVHGLRGTSFELLFEVKQGFMQLGAPRNFAACTAGQLAPAADGRLELWLGGPARPERWLPIDPDARWLLVREFLLDPSQEAPAALAIECLDPPAGGSLPATRAQVEGRIAAAAAWVEATAGYWTAWVAELRAAHVPGRLAPARRYAGGADDILYGNDWFRLGPDEALVIETEPPDARYWSFQLCDACFRSLDATSRSTRVNQRQARVDPDGLVRIVVAHADPGTPNWLDTAGRLEGVLQYRWIWARSFPQPRARLASFAALGGILAPNRKTRRARR